MPARPASEMHIPGFAPQCRIQSFGLVMPATGKGYGQGPGVPRSGPERGPGGPRTRATDKGHEFLDQAPDEGHEFLDQAPEEGHGRRGRHGGGPRSSAAEGHGRRRISHKGGVIVSKTYQICVLEGLKKKAALRNNTVPQHNAGEGDWGAPTGRESKTGQTWTST